MFWKELEIKGARVYEAADFDWAIELIAGGTLPLDALVTAVEPLERLPDVFAELGGGAAMKVLVDCH
jgi:threonine dehydrogenase-like Zn-dependent dehydrogenase